MRSRRRHWGLALLVWGGCGRVAFEPLGDASGFSADACTFGPWGAPQLIAGLSTDRMERGGQVTADGLGFYYSIDNNLYVGHRPDRASVWTRQLITDVDASEGQYDPTVTGDDLELIFTREESSGFHCLYSSTRTSTAEPWSAPVRLPEMCAAEVGGAYVTADGLTLYYTPVMEGGEGSIWVTSRADRSARFQAGAQVSGLPGLAVGDFGFPALSGDQLTVYFETGFPIDLHQATRPTLGAPFSAPTPLAEINTVDDDEDVSITADGTELYFDSDRPGGPGMHDVYVATRSCL